MKGESREIKNGRIGRKGHKEGDRQANRQTK